MCEHLKPVEDLLRQQGIPEVWRGQPWTENCREWIYFDCILNPAGLIESLQLPAVVKIHDYNDIKAGSERGLICDQCKDGVIGMHPDYQGSKDKPVIS